MTVLIRRMEQGKEMSGSMTSITTYGVHLRPGGPRSCLTSFLNLIDRAYMYIQSLYDCKHQHSPLLAHISHAIPLACTRHVTQRPHLPVMVRLVEALARGHTSFEQRFPGKERRLDAGLPPFAPWRSNLVRALFNSNY